MHRHRCTACGLTAPAAFFCGACGALQAGHGRASWLQLLGLPESPAVDLEQLEARYYELSRRLHPDRVQTARPEELQTSVRASSILNDAYRTLRDPERRGRWWLEHRGRSLGGTGRALSGTDSALPPVLAAFVFETQEKLAECRPNSSAARTRLRHILDEVQTRRRSELQRLEETLTTWPSEDEGAALDRLRDLLAALSYLTTLERDVTRAGDDRVHSTPVAPGLPANGA